jgi:hypothetical protein
MAMLVWLTITYRLLVITKPKPTITCLSLIVGCDKIGWKILVSHPFFHPNVQFNTIKIAPTTTN